MDWREIKDDKEKYAAYLCSREWGVLKEAVRERAFGKCERCFMRDMSAVHHLTYARKYQERIEDLQAICNGCHEFTHGKASDDPRLTDVVRPQFQDDKFGSLILCPVCSTPSVRIFDAKAYADADLPSVRTHFHCENRHLFELSCVAFRRGIVAFYIHRIERAE